MVNFLKWFKKKPSETQKGLHQEEKPENQSPLIISLIKSELTSIETLTNIKDSKRQLQHLDELISIAEMEIISLSKNLDSIIIEEKKVEVEIKNINNPNSWAEQSLLLKLKRLRTHSNNLKQRITIYSQNIELYLNMICRIQDLQAMKMGNIDENKIENIWLEYKEELEQYKNRLLTGQAAEETTAVTLSHLEIDLKEIRKEIIPEPRAPEPESIEVKTERSAIEEVIKNLKENEESVSSLSFE